MTKNQTAPVICFGEILWDSLPGGMFPGGAPFNVAYHLRQLQMRSIPVTAVGKDTLGDELLRRLAGWGIETDFVAEIPGKMTGLARVSVKDGSPTFEIVRDVAWDWIEVAPELLQLAETAQAVVFGTLAQRCPHDREKLQLLLSRCQKALKVFDVNLRAPFDQPEIVWSTARHADLIKLNHDELFRLLELPTDESQIEPAARRFAERTACAKLCVTGGKLGAGFLDKGQWHWETAQPVKVQDTVGAGDSFLAALIQGLCAGHLTPPQMLRRACRLAEFVASRSGATPTYRVNAEGDIADEAATSSLQHNG